jgi:hypothetical protein
LDDLDLDVGVNLPHGTYRGRCSQVADASEDHSLAKQKELQGGQEARAVQKTRHSTDVVAIVLLGGAPSPLDNPSGAVGHPTDQRKVRLVSWNLGVAAALLVFLHACLLVLALEAVP